MKKWIAVGGAAAGLGIGACVAGSGGGERAGVATPALPPESPATGPVATVSYLAPEKFTAMERRGIGWLVAAQNGDGGWGEDAGTESVVGNTALCALVLIRSGHTPERGEHRAAVQRAVDYIRRAASAAADRESSIEPKRNTQLQRKLGPNVDTFLAALLLAEVGERLPEAIRPTIREELQKCVDRIEQSQREDGSWNNGGWAPVLNSCFAAVALERARDVGAKVDDARIVNAKKYALGNFDTEGKSFAKGAMAGGAGVELYAAAASQRMLSVKRAPASAPAEVRRLEEIVEARSGDAKQAALGRLSDENFLKGFGSFGGEEFYSYMAVSEALSAKGGDEWSKWDGGIRTRLANLQNQDGSWAGHHCITGRVPCTAGALLTLLCASN
ncbi:MAG: hypothetical protein L0216_17755 [Planctomycetales bacterium]|nr:hypothetical protein [Planctomycetales bacterium]